MYRQSSKDPLFVAIDAGKNVHCYGAYTGLDLQLVQPAREVHNNRSGYGQFQSWLNRQLESGQYSQVILGIEPTGIYHEPWAYAIQDDFADQVDLRLLNPYQTKQKRKQLQNGRQRKTDAIDVQAMAHCLRDGLGHPAWLSQGDTLRFELWAADLRQLRREQQRLQVNLLAQIDRLWPGALVNVRAFRQAHPTLETPVPLVLSRPLQRKLVRFVLKHRPNPYDWLEFSLSDLQTFFRSHGLRCGPKTAQKMFDVVHNALLPPDELAQGLSERLQADWLRFQILETRLDQLCQQADNLVHHSPAAVLTTFTGISTFLAAQYLAYVLDVRRFQHADQIWSLAGFDVAQDDSGDRRRRGKITKRGDGGLRQVLYTIGLNTSQHCPAIARAKERALQRGKGKVGAVIHAAHKANRICYHLLLHQVPFDPQLVR